MLLPKLAGFCVPSVHVCSAPEAVSFLPRSVDKSHLSASPVSPQGPVCRLYRCASHINKDTMERKLSPGCYAEFPEVGESDGTGYLPILPGTQP